MTRIFDEKLEGAGYEETGADETVGAGCTIDEDVASSDVGSPSGWGSQCLKIVSAANQSAYVQWSNFGPEAISHFRFEIVVTAKNDLGGTYVIIFEVKSDAGNICFTGYMEQHGGQTHFNLYCLHDGNGHDFYSLLPISLDTRYRIEVKWDATNNAWAWKINGVDQPNDQDATSPITSEGTLTGTHETDCDYIIAGNRSTYNYSYTAYFDLIAIDDADWVGSEEFVVGDLLIKQSFSDDFVNDDITYIRQAFSDNYVGSNGNILIKQPFSDNYIDTNGVEYIRQPFSDDFVTTLLQFIRQPFSENRKIKAI